MGVNSHPAFDEKPGIKFVWPKQSGSCTDSVAYIGFYSYQGSISSIARAMCVNTWSTEKKIDSFYITL